MLNNLNANIQACIDHSVEVAIFLNYMAQWSYHNLANNKNIHDGIVWTYNSIEAFKKYFPYWTGKQLLLVIKKAIDAGLVQKGNYNQNKYDRTTWYALTEKGRAYYPELNQTESPEEGSTTDLSKKANEFAQKDKPIPTINTTSKSLKKDINKKTLISKKDVDPEQVALVMENNPHKISEEMIEDWIRIRKGKKKGVTKTGIDLLNKVLTQIKESLNISPVEAFATMVFEEWQSLKLKYFENHKKPQGRFNDKGNFITITSWS